MPISAITQMARRSTRTFTRRTSTTVRIVPIEKMRSTSGAQYGSSSEAREKITSRVPSSTAASTANAMPRRPRAWSPPSVHDTRMTPASVATSPASCSADGRSPWIRP